MFLKANGILTYWATNPDHMLLIQSKFQPIPRPRKKNQSNPKHENPLGSPNPKLTRPIYPSDFKSNSAMTNK